MTISTAQRQRIDGQNAENREAAQAARRRAIYRARVLTVARKWAAEGMHPREAASRLGCCPDWLSKRL